MFEELVAEKLALFGQVLRVKNKAIGTLEL